MQVVRQLISVAEQESWHVDDATAVAQLDRVFRCTADALQQLKMSSGVKPADRSGSCALLLALHRARLSVAHVGDCRAVLGTYVGGAGGEGGEGDGSGEGGEGGGGGEGGEGSGGGEGGEGVEGGGCGEAVLKTIELTTDHTPACQPECARIRACGAYVQESSSNLVVVAEAVSSSSAAFTPRRVRAYVSKQVSQSVSQSVSISSSSIQYSATRTLALKPRVASVASFRRRTGTRTAASSPRASTARPSGAARARAPASR